MDRAKYLHVHDRYGWSRVYAVGLDQHDRAERLISRLDVLRGDKWRWITPSRARRLARHPLDIAHFALSDVEYEAEVDRGCQHDVEMLRRYEEEDRAMLAESGDGKAVA